MYHLHPHQLVVQGTLGPPAQVNLLQRTVSAQGQLHYPKDAMCPTPKCDFLQKKKRMFVGLTLLEKSSIIGIGDDINQKHPRLTNNITKKQHFLVGQRSRISLLYISPEVAMVTRLHILDLLTS